MEKSLYPKTFEIIANATENLNSFSDTFVYEPENIEEEKLGFLYLIGQVISKQEEKSQAAYLLNLIATQTSQNFYKKNTFSSKEAFEKTMLEINRLIHDLVDEDKLVWLKRINLAIVLLVPQSGELCFATLGEAQGLLWRKGQIMDISKDFIDQGPQIFTEKLFKNIAIGSVQLHDKLIFSAPLLSDKIKIQNLKIFIDEMQHTGFDIFKERLNLKNDDMALVVLDIGNERLILPKAKKTALGTTTIARESKKNYVALYLELAKKFAKKTLSFFARLIPKKKLPSPKQIVDKLYDKEKMVFLDKPVNFKKPRFRFPLFRFPKPKLPLFRKQYLLIFVPLCIALIVLAIIFSLHHKKPNPLSADPYATTIEKPTPYFDLAKYTLTFDAKGLTSQNNQFIFFDKSSLYLFDSQTKKGSFMFPVINASSTFAFESTLGTNLAFLAPEGEIALLKDNLKDIEVKKLTRTSNASVMDIANFEDNLYLLLENGKILKYPKLNFTQPSLWLNSSTSTNQNSISMTIDKNIYVLEKSGLIYQYAKGKKVENYSITVPGIVAQGDKILTRPNFKNLYLLSRSQNKIMIFDKTTQQLVKKLVSPLWKKMTAFDISQDEKTIYLLDNLKVYEIKI